MVVISLTFTLLRESTSLMQIKSQQAPTVLLSVVVFLSSVFVHTSVGLPPE